MALPNFGNEKKRYEYLVNGILHRDDGPAIYYPDSKNFFYYKHGLLHRQNGPAKYSAFLQTTEYYQFGVLHREDGPAVSRERNYTLHYVPTESGYQSVDYKAGLEFWLGGKKVTEEFFWRFNGKK